MAENDDTTFALSIDGTRYSFDFDDLEIGEAELLEEELGQALEDVDWRRVKTLRVLTYLILHRERPEITMDEVRGMKISDFVESANGAQPERPTKAPAAKRASKRAATGRPR